MKRIATAVCTASLALSLAASCTPELYRAGIDMPERYFGAEGFPADSLPDNPRWWEIFGDERLDELETAALAGNRDLRVAASRVKEAAVNLRNVKSSFLPQISLRADAEASYGSDRDIDQEYTLQTSASWQVSLFGTWRNTRRAAQAEFLSADWAAYGVLLSLTAEVASAYFTLAGYCRQLDIAERTYALRSESAALIDSMYRYGFSSQIDVQRSRSMAAAAAADIPRYRQAVAGARYSLGVLLGLTPEQALDIVVCDSLPVGAFPVEVPVGLPSDLLQRRPDIMQAMYEMRAAEARTGIARSARFPSLSLTGQGGVFGSSVKSFADLDKAIWSAAGSLTAPLFAFGRLKCNERIACEEYMQAAGRYEQAVLQALCDVESALDAIAMTRERLAACAVTVEADARAGYLTRELYRAGMSAYLDVIDTERESYESQIEYAELVAGQYVNYVDLIKALGTGWRLPE